ncbi:DUF927 domain-containing protein [Psychrobacter celer]|uniref:DUF927 domain-containing protein n=1 Tax=Psychrobacter celer TaxID=306572 RepID=UPI003FD030ED
MNKTKDKNAHADNMGADTILDGCKPATRQELAGNKLLIKMLDLLEPERLLTVLTDITVSYNDEVGKILSTANTIAIALTDKNSQNVGAVFFDPNGEQKPIVINPTGYGAIIMGSNDPNQDTIALTNLDDALDVYAYTLADNLTLIISADSRKHTYKQTVQHWSDTRRVIAPVTLDDTPTKNLLAGVSAQMLVTDAHIVTKLKAIESYQDIKEQAELIDLADTTHYPKWRKDKSPMLNAPMVHENGRFELYADGLYFVIYNHDDPSNITLKYKSFICSPIEVIAMVRNETSGNWGRLLQWYDADSVLHKWAMPMQLLQADTREYRRELASFGLIISTNSKQRSLLDAYIQNYPIYQRGLCVDNLGWHGDKYVLPATTLGADDGQLIVYQAANAINSTLTQRGTHAQWRDKLSQPLAEQSRFVFSISCAFAGQLLEPLGYDGGGFHILGSSSMGKSLSLKVASSVWGKPDTYAKTWRSTDNALEGTACEYNHSLLPLDEISECDPKVVGKAVYMLANGQGKARSTTTGHNRTAKEWDIIFLSNGEESLQNFIAQAGQKPNAGIEVRIAHIDADAGKGLKTFDSLVMADTGEAQADKIRDLAYSYYGSAGMAWLEHITKDKAATTAQAKQLIKDFMSRYPDIKAQAHRVGTRFAIVAAAGEIATDAGITGWQTGQAVSAVQVCFDNWLDNYGRDGEHEQRQIIEHIKGFIEQHGASRFQPCFQTNSNRIQYDEKTPNRAGYRNEGTGDYYFFTSRFDKEVCSPFSKAKVLQVLAQNDLLLLNQGDRKTYKVPDTLFIGKQRPPFYAVKADILSRDFEN